MYAIRISHVGDHSVLGSIIENVGMNEISEYATANELHSFFDQEFIFILESEEDAVRAQTQVKEIGLANVIVKVEYTYYQRGFSQNIAQDSSSIPDEE